MMELHMIGNETPAVVLSRDDEAGTAQVLVLSGARQTVSVSDLYDLDGNPLDSGGPAMGSATTSTSSASQPPGPGERSGEQFAGKERAADATDPANGSETVSQPAGFTQTDAPAESPQAPAPATGQPSSGVGALSEQPGPSLADDATMSADNPTNPRRQV